MLEIGIFLSVAGNLGEIMLGVCAPFLVMMTFNSARPAMPSLFKRRVIPRLVFHDRRCQHPVNNQAGEVHDRHPLEIWPFDFSH